MYWKNNLSKEQVVKEVHKKKNQIYMGQRHDGEQLFCTYPELGKGKESFGFWFEQKAITLLQKAINVGGTVNRYAGSQCQQFYIVGVDKSTLGLQE